MTRVLLVRLHGALVGGAGHPRNCRPPWPLKYLEAMLGAAGFPVRLHDALVRPGPVDTADADVVVVQATTLDLPELRAFAAGLRARAVIAVGQVTFSPEAAAGIPGVDAVVRGEPEEVVLDLVRRLDRGEPLPDVSGTPAIVEAPDALPVPRFTRAELHDYRMDYPLRVGRRVRWGHVLSSRGCPHACVFCSPVTRETWGPRFRPRAAAAIRAEVDALARLGANAICFDDDDLTASPKHARAVSAALRGLGMPWIAHARVDDVDGPLLEEMAAAGCVLLRFGVETGSERVLDALRKTRRSEWRRRALDVFARCRALGIGTTALFLVGNPDETRAEAEETLDLALELAPDLVQFHYFTPYPGSDAFDDYADRLPTDAVASLYHYRPPALNPSRMGDAELAELQGEFYRRFFGRPRFLARHALVYAPFYARNPDVLLRIAPGLRRSPP